MLAVCAALCCSVLPVWRVFCLLTCSGMLPTDFSGLAWLRTQISQVMDSVWEAATAPTPTPQPKPSKVEAGVGLATGHLEGFRPDIILANQLAYGQAGFLLANFECRSVGNTLQGTGFFSWQQGGGMFAFKWQAIVSLSCLLNAYAAMPCSGTCSAWHSVDVIAGCSFAWSVAPLKRSSAALHCESNQSCFLAAQWRQTQAAAGSGPFTARALKSDVTPLFRAPALLLLLRLLMLLLMLLQHTCRCMLQRSWVYPSTSFSPSPGYQHQPCLIHGRVHSMQT